MNKFEQVSSLCHQMLAPGAPCAVGSNVQGAGANRALWSGVPHPQSGGPGAVRSHVQRGWEDPSVMTSNASYVMVTWDPPCSQNDGQKNTLKILPSRNFVGGS